MALTPVVQATGSKPSSEVAKVPSISSRRRLQSAEKTSSTTSSSIAVSSSEKWNSTTRPTSGYSGKSYFEHSRTSVRQWNLSIMALC